MCIRDRLRGEKLKPGASRGAHESDGMGYGGWEDDCCSADTESPVQGQGVFTDSLSGYGGAGRGTLLYPDSVDG